MSTKEELEAQLATIQEQIVILSVGPKTESVPIVGNKVNPNNIGFPVCNIGSEVYISDFSYLIDIFIAFRKEYIEPQITPVDIDAKVSKSGNNMCGTTIISEARVAKWNPAIYWENTIRHMVGLFLNERTKHKAIHLTNLRVKYPEIFTARIDLDFKQIARHIECSPMKISNDNKYNIELLLSWYHERFSNKTCKVFNVDIDRSISGISAEVLFTPKLRDDASILNLKNRIMEIFGHVL
jgi:hypothetical protein